jgi:hypothetical protein
VSRESGRGPGRHPDYGRVVAHKDALQLQRYDQHARQVAELSDRLTLIDGTAELLDADTVEVSTEAGTKAVASRRQPHFWPPAECGFTS